MPELVLGSLGRSLSLSLRLSVYSPPNENCVKKSQSMPVWFSKMVLAQHSWAACWGCYKAQQSLTYARNEYDLTAVPCFWLANHNDWSRWFALSSFPPIWSHSFSFMGGIGKKVNNYTWVWEIFLQLHALSTTEDALKFLIVSSVFDWNAIFTSSSFSLHQSYRVMGAIVSNTPTSFPMFEVVPRWFFELCSFICLASLSALLIISASIELIYGTKVSF